MTTQPILHPINIPKLLEKYALRPEKRYGQNFLIDSETLEKIIQIADLEPEETVMEIGPGLGSLTRLLALQSSKVIAIELDSRLINPLQEILASFQNVKIIQGDILNIPQKQWFDDAVQQEQRSYTVVANIPYNITSALIRYLLEINIPPKKIVLTIQKEVAERICVTSGKMSLLALSVLVYGKPNLATIISSSSFYPKPDVDSAVIKILIHEKPIIPKSQLNIFFLLAHAGFSQKRKTLKNSLSAGMHWDKSYTQSILVDSDIDPQRRAETLSLNEWKKLLKKVIEKHE